MMAVSLLSTSALAQEYCVTCNSPAATYRCVIADPQPGAAQSLQSACTAALAREGKHDQCIIKRGVTVFECDAPVKRVSLGDQARGPVVLVAPAVPAPDPNAPPATVLEAIKRAQASSGNATTATGEGLKKGLICLGTLFMRCD